MTFACLLLNQKINESWSNHKNNGSLSCYQANHYSFHEIVGKVFEVKQYVKVQSASEYVNPMFLSRIHVVYLKYNFF